MAGSSASGAETVRAEGQAVESRIPVSPAQAAVPDLDLPAVAESARVVVAEQPLAERMSAACQAPGQAPQEVPRRGELRTDGHTIRKR